MTARASAGRRVALWPAWRRPSLLARRGRSAVTPVVADDARVSASFAGAGCVRREGTPRRCVQSGLHGDVHVRRRAAAARPLCALIRRWARAHRVSSAVKFDTLTRRLPGRRSAQTAACVWSQRVEARVAGARVADDVRQRARSNRSRRSSRTPTTTCACGCASVRGRSVLVLAARPATTTRAAQTFTFIR